MISQEIPGGICPHCSQPSPKTVIVFDRGKEWSRYSVLCLPCEAQTARAKVEIRAVLDGFEGLSQRTYNTLARSANVFEFKSGAELLAATDDELMALRLFGRAALEEFRRFVPHPIPLAPRSPVREEVESYFSTRPDVLSVIGG